MDNIFFDENSCGDEKMDHKSRMTDGGMMMRKSKSKHTNVHHMDSLSMYMDEESIVDVEEEKDKNHRRAIVDKADEIVRLKKYVGILQVGETCPICLAEDVDTILNPCGHFVHAKCIKRWVSQCQCDLNCPMCRISTHGIHEAFEKSHAALSSLASSRRLNQSWNFSDTTSASEESCTNTSGGAYHEEQDGFEWGWFEDFDVELDHHPNFYDYLYGMGKRPPGTSDLMVPFAQEIHKTFSPLNPQMEDVLYLKSPFEWVRGLSSTRHIEAKIQIRSFRIVEGQGRLHTQHAEYLVELNLDGKYFSRWLRYTAFQNFMINLPSCRFKKTRHAWKRVEAKKRWLNRLEIGYLHERCRLLEIFAQTLLFESTTIHTLAELLEV
jgi:hypothetical protein